MKPEIRPQGAASDREGPWPFRLLLLRAAIAAVWIVFGVGFKLLGMVPRHRLIVASIVGEAAAGPVTLLVGGAEALLGLWVLSGIRPRTCAAVQTLAIASMNTLELRSARGLLLAPVGMVCANVAFLAVVWYCALKSPARAAAS